MEIKNIWFECDEWENGFDENNDSIDVHFDIEDGSRWCAEFMTYQYMMTLAEKNKCSGEMLGGQYFYSDKPIFIKRIDKALIVSVLNDIIQTETELDKIFTKVDSSNE